MEVAKRFPNRVSTIYISSVSDTEKVERVSSLIESATDIDVVLIQKIAEAENHALSKGYFKN